MKSSAVIRNGTPAAEGGDTSRVGGQADSNTPGVNRFCPPQSCGQRAGAQQDPWVKLVVLAELEETGSVVEQCPTLGLPWDMFWGLGDIPLTYHTGTLMGAQASSPGCTTGKFQTESK